jgi:hypothetical protein
LDRIMHTVFICFNVFSINYFPLILFRSLSIPGTPGEFSQHISSQPLTPRRTPTRINHLNTHNIYIIYYRKSTFPAGQAYSSWGFTYSIPLSFSHSFLDSSKASILSSFQFIVSSNLTSLAITNSGFTS